MPPDPDDPLLRRTAGKRTTGCPEEGRELERVPATVVARDQAGKRRVELHPVLVPHGELLLRVAAVRPTLGRIPGPGAMGIQLVEPILQRTGNELASVALEVAVDVVRMVLVLEE